MQCALQTQAAQWAVSAHVRQPQRQIVRPPSVGGLGSAHATREFRKACLCAQCERRPVGRGQLAVRAAKTPLIDLDQRKEDSLPYRRTVFTMDDWKKHRSSYRHSRHMQTLLTSRIIRALIPPTLTATAAAVFVCAYNSAFGDHVLPEYFPLLHVSGQPFGLVSPALGLLLVFRTNASYNRFDEARKLWGATLNRVRDVARQTLSYITDEKDYALQQEVLRHAKAFPLALKYHLIAEGDLVQDLKPHMLPHEIEPIMTAAHKPGYCLQVISNCYARAVGITTPNRLILDPNLTAFYDYLGGMERLFKTPIPVSYTRLTSRFLVVWHLLLPFGLWDSCHWLTVPATLFSAAALFCIEEVGVVIEEPFSILALAAICQSCTGSVDNLNKENKQYLASLKAPSEQSQNGASLSMVK